MVVAEFVEEAPVAFLHEFGEVDAVFLRRIDPAHERIARVHEAGGDLPVRDHALRREPAEADEVVFEDHRLVPPFQQGLRVGQLLHRGSLDVQDDLLAGEGDPGGGQLLGFRPRFRGVLAEHVGRHRDGVAELQRRGRRGLHRLTPVLVRALDENLAAEGVGDLVLADLEFEGPRDDRKAVPFRQLQQAIAVAADDHLYRAMLGDRGDLHDDDFAGRSVEAGLLPDVGARVEVGCAAVGGVPAVDEIGIIGDRPGDALLAFDDTREVAGSGVGFEGARLLRHVSLDGRVQFGAVGFGGLDERSLLRRRDLFDRRSGERGGGREQGGAKQTHGEGWPHLGFRSYARQRQTL